MDVEGAPMAKAMAEDGEHQVCHLIDCTSQTC